MSNSIRFHEEPVTQIWDRLFVGCYYDAEMLNKQNPYQIDFVLNCTPDPIKFWGDIETVTLGLEDGHDVPKAALTKAIDALSMAFRQGKTVLVHCHAGMSRAPSITAAYMYAAGFKDFDQCVQFIKDKRPIIMPHHKIVTSIKKIMGVWPYREDWLK